MRNYLDLVPKYLSAHKKNTRLTVISVVLSVALVTGIFSMLDALLKFEKIQVIHDLGNYHIVIKDASWEEMQAISSRIDVQNAGRWVSVGKGTINGVSCIIGALDENFAENMNIKLVQGKYPTEKNELMLEQWAAVNLKPGLKINDTVGISTADGIAGKFVISGIYNDLGGTKAEGIPGVLLSVGGAANLAPEIRGDCLVLFKNRVNIMKAEDEIKKALNIPDDRVGRNERLLAVIGQSEHKAAVGIYTVGAILFFIVLVAGVMMIYNTFNISVADRVRQFGLLRCIGASREQIRKLVRREGLAITFMAIPTGVLAGILITFACSAVLKFFTKSLFRDIPLISISLSGIGAGVAIGFLTVSVASFLPAKKAAAVSPASAVAGNGEIRISKRRKQGALTKALRAEIAIGIGNAVMKKKTLFLMSCSIAVSIILFLGFQVFIDLMYKSLKTPKPYTPDISLVSEQGLSDGLYEKLKGMDGIRNAYGRMFAHVDASFDATRLTEFYKETVSDIKVKDNGTFIPPEKSWLISYEKNQLNWARSDLIGGTLDEDKINAQNGVIAVVRNIRGGITAQTADLKLDDKVYFHTPKGVKELTVVGILRSVPFSDSGSNLATFVTTEKLFTELTGKSRYDIIDIQLNKRNQERTVNSIKGMLDSSISLYDARQKNAELRQTFLTMAVFVYGFVAVIALNSVLNIINTMNTSVASKTRYLGVMRAVGMSGGQLNKMVLTEAATYSLTGCLSGCVLGLMLQKALITNWLSSFHIIWKFPLAQIILILVLTILVTAVSVASPLKRVKSKGIPEVIASL